MDEEELLRWMVNTGILQPGAIVQFEPLSGGVSSDVIRVQTEDQTFLLKRALPKLRVKEEWFASPERGITERKCLKQLDKIIPGSVPKVLFHDDRNGLFAMEFLDGASDWKRHLMQGRLDPEIPGRIGRLLAEIHRRSYRSDRVLASFREKKLFYELRISPYFLFIKDKFPSCRNKLDSLSEQLMESEDVLTHGDFSPKNILVRNGKPVIVDCEVAHAGHPSFDIAFIIHHLLLKSMHVEPMRLSYLGAAKELYRVYFENVMVISEDAYRAFTHQTIGALLLARTDGKSPAEYLTDAGRETARRLGKSLLEASISNLDQITMEVLEYGGD